MLAIGPVLLALPARRVTALAVAGIVTCVVLAPLAILGNHAGIVQGAASTGSVIFQPWQAWWFLGDAGHFVIGGDRLPKPSGYRVPPQWLAPLTHPLIAFLVVPLSLLWARVRGAAPRLRGEQLLLLLALLALLRCVLDPGTPSTTSCRSSSRCSRGRACAGPIARRSSRSPRPRSRG